MLNTWSKITPSEFFNNGERVCNKFITIHVTVTWFKMPDHFSLTDADHQIKLDVLCLIWSCDQCLSTFWHFVSSYCYINTYLPNLNSDLYKWQDIFQIKVTNRTTDLGGKKVHTQPPPPPPPKKEKNNGGIINMCNEGRCSQNSDWIQVLLTLIPSFFYSFTGKKEIKCKPYDTQHKNWQAFVCMLLCNRDIKRTTL